MQIASFYLWLKAFHLIFMVTWFAGLFYLPRLFIYHAEADDQLSRDRFHLMEKRLFIIMTIGAVLTIIFGLILIYVITGIERQVWFQMKFILIIGLIFFHLKCWCWIKKLRDGFITKNTNKLRLFNEIPVFFLISIVILAILKPF
jgi:protoporphyrinogen IX oxidase|tara:strand:+ start:320 stop:754 length:435 start_codon:yes stop_codon:yes gene_type:complete